MKVHDHIRMADTQGRIYVVGDRDLVMIDTCPSEHIAGAIKALEAEGIDFSRLRALILTHLHYDHAAGAAYVRERFRIPVICGDRDAQYVASADPVVTAASIWPGSAVHHVPACTIDYVVDEGDEVHVGDLVFHIHAFPGHTAGGIGIEWEGQLFTGDTVYPNGGIGWSDAHWTSNLPDHANTIRKLKDIAPKRMYGGHGEPGDYRPEVVDEALEHVKELWNAGIPSKVSTPAEPRKGDPRIIVVEGQPKDPELGPGKKDPTPRDLPLYEIWSGDLRAAMRPAGEHHGLILAAADGTPITRPFFCTMNLEHYCSTGACGFFTPRRDVAQSYEITPDGMAISFGPNPEWNLHARISYTRREPGAFDVVFEFTFGENYPNFEAFIASYFHGKRIPYLLTDAGPVRPRIEPKQQLFFPRDDGAAQQIGDGRWNVLRKVNLYGEADPEGRRYAVPLTIHRDDETGWSLVQMADRNFCGAVSVNTFAYAQDFSLVSRDVSAGEHVRVAARVQYAKLDAPEDALELYGVFENDIETLTRT